MATVTITIEDDKDGGEKSVATITTVTDWKEGDEASPAVVVAGAMMRMMEMIQGDQE